MMLSTAYYRREGGAAEAERAIDLNSASAAPELAKGAPKPQPRGIFRGQPPNPDRVRIRGRVQCEGRRLAGEKLLQQAHASAAWRRPAAAAGQCAQG